MNRWSRIRSDIRLRLVWVPSGWSVRWRSRFDNCYLYCRCCGCRMLLVRFHRIHSWVWVRRGWRRHGSPCRPSLFVQCPWLGGRGLAFQTCDIRFLPWRWVACCVPSSFGLRFGNRVWHLRQHCPIFRFAIRRFLSVGSVLLRECSCSLRSFLSAGVLHCCRCPYLMCMPGLRSAWDLPP